MGGPFANCDVGGVPLSVAVWLCAEGAAERALQGQGRFPFFLGAGIRDLLVAVIGQVG